MGIRCSCWRQFGAFASPGFVHERFETFRRARVTKIVEPIQIQCGLDAPNIRLRAIDGRGIDLPYEARRNDGRQQADDHHHDHDLEQRKTLLDDAKRCSDHAH